MGRKKTQKIIVYIMLITMLVTTLLAGVSLVF
ncbi:stressosome-associated protein Prli42 [Peribacillus sp. SCS-26]